MTEQDFLKFYTGFYGETVDDLKQITHHAFDGQELYEFVNAAIKNSQEKRLYLTAEQIQKLANIGSRRTYENVGEGYVLSFAGVKEILSQYEEFKKESSNDNLRSEYKWKITQ